MMQLFIFNSEYKIYMKYSVYNFLHCSEFSYFYYNTSSKMELIITINKTVDT